MTEDLIAQVKAMEADADEVVSEAVRRAEEVRGSVPQKVSELREEQRLRYQKEIDAIRQAKEAEAREEIQKVDEQAKAIEQRLESVDSQAVSRAVDMILQQLREG